MDDMMSPRHASSETVLMPSIVASALLPSGIEAAQIREEVERIVVSSAFRASKRNCSLLRHVVEAALNGSIDDLKERRIGVDVFGRSADYDTNADHVVRSVAGEVRRRLAQYYMQCESDSGIRIELPAGSYVPQFRLAQERPVSTIPALLSNTVVVEPRLRTWHRWAISTIAAASVAAAIMSASTPHAGLRLSNVSGSPSIRPKALYCYASAEAAPDHTLTNLPSPRRLSSLPSRLRGGCTPTMPWSWRL